MSDHLKILLGGIAIGYVLGDVTRPYLDRAGVTLARRVARALGNENTP